MSNRTKGYADRLNKQISRTKWAKQKNKLKENKKKLKQVANRNRMNHFINRTKGKLKQNKTKAKQHMAIKNKNSINKGTKETDTPYSQ